MGRQAAGQRTENALNQTVGAARFCLLADGSCCTADEGKQSR